MRLRLRMAALAVGMSFAVLPLQARAQAPCSIKTITGTYAAQIGGGAFAGDLVTAGVPYRLTGGVASLVARVTVAADGSVQGPMWGVFVAEPVEGPYLAHVTVNPDCTGQWVDPDYSFRFVVLEQGEEIRSIAWEGVFNSGIQTWHRITRAADPAPRCGQHSFRGNYAMRCEGYELTGEGSGLASASMLFVLSAADGVMTGRMYASRFGLPFPAVTESGVSGTYAVHEDCTLDGDMSLDVLPGLAYRTRGVLFDQGKQAVGLPLGIYAGDTFVAPVLPLRCDMTRLGQ